MPTFEYIARKPGAAEELRGRIEADTERDARSRLRLRGEVPLSLAPVRVRTFALGRLLPSFARGNFQQEVMMFSTQLSTLIRSGITLTDALRVLAEQSTQRQFSNILQLVYQSVVERGSSFATALKPFPQAFPSLYVSMVKAGESTGTLSDVLDRLASYSKKKSDIEARIKSAMTYPVIMLIVALGVITFLLSYLVPKILPILKSRGRALPLPTEILVTVSEAVKSYWYLGLIAVIGLMFVYRAVVATQKGRLLVDQALLSMPIFGELARKGAVSRFCITLSSLLRSGVKIEESLRIVEEVVGNSVVQKTVREISSHVREGASIAGPLSQNKVFPKVVIFMISVGEKAGSEELQEMLDNISEAFDTEVQQSAERLTGLLNPLMLVFLAGMVGFILMAILLPIMNLSKF